MIEVSNVVKYYGKTKAVDGISLTVSPGTIHGLIGINGAGKTTLIKAMVGIHPIDEGSIKIFGEEVFENAAIKEKVAYVADRNRFFKHYTIQKLVKFYQQTYPKFSIDKFNEYNQVMKLNPSKKINALSKGMQMRLSIMLNLARNPEVLILDEPTSGLDAIAKKEVLQWIISEVEERNIAVLISSHHLSELEMLCDEMTMISYGKMIYQDTVDELKEKVIKIQVVFKEPQDLSTWPEVIDITSIGSVNYIVAKDETIIPKLELLGTVLIEIIPMSVEEVFIYTNKEGN